MVVLEASARRRIVCCAASVLVGAALGLGAVLAVPGTSQAATAPKPAPVPLKTLRISGGLPIALQAGTLARQSPAAVPVDAGMRFSMVGLVCDTPALAGEVMIRLRTSSDGRSWSVWRAAALEQNAEAGHSGESYIEPLWIGSGRYLQVSASVGAPRARLRLTDVRVAAIASVPDGSMGVAAERAAPRSAADAAGVSRGNSDPAGPAEPPIVSREQWGADESLRKASPSYATVKMAFIHHTDTGNDYTRADAPALVRGIYAYHTQTLGWDDIGYNFLIDRYGTIYEGRSGGLSRGVIAAQALGFNTGSTGIALIGTFTGVAPPAAALSSLEKLLAWKLSLCGLDPLGTVTMTCGMTERFKAGARVVLPVIAGHRDVNATACPGDALYALLPAIRRGVAALIAPAAWAVKLTLSRSRVDADHMVTCSGTVAGAASAPGSGSVTLQRRRAAGGSWSDWRTAQLTGTGGYAVAVRMTSAPRDWQLRARMPGDGAGHLTACSPIVALHVGAPAPWAVGLTLSRSRVDADHTVSCSGEVHSVTGLPGSGQVTLQRRPAAGGDWSDWRTVTLNASGAYAVTVKMRTAPRTWQLRTRMPAAGTNLTGCSTARSLAVNLPAWRVTLGLSRTSAPLGSPVRFSGSVKTTSGCPGSGTLTLERRPASGGTWRTWRTVTLDTRGGYAIKVTMTNRSSWEVRGRMAGTAANLTGLSAIKRLTIVL
jgi:N-acetylmuramoyl-L-alanine amidase